MRTRKEVMMKGYRQTHGERRIKMEWDDIVNDSALREY